MPTPSDRAKTKQKASCRNKRKLGESLAYKIAAGMNAKGKYTKPYKCSICNGWHICSRNKVSILNQLFDQIVAERKHKATAS